MMSAADSHLLKHSASCLTCQRLNSSSGLSPKQTSEAGNRTSLIDKGIKQQHDRETAAPASYTSLDMHHRRHQDVQRQRVLLPVQITNHYMRWFELVSSYLYLCFLLTTLQNLSFLASLTSSVRFLASLSAAVG